MSRRVRIGCASAFWGDTRTAAAQLVGKGKVDYLVFDYLAEVTMSILAGAKLRDPTKGYATDFVSIIAPLMGEIKKKGIRVVTNAGGLNPGGLKEAIKSAVGSRVDVKIALVTGDDLMNRLDEVRELKPRDLETGETLPENLVSVNAYLGARGIVKALQLGADVVITGRCVDSALVLGPLVYEFGWDFAGGDFDRLAGGSIAGHILECGAQCTGGNFTDWRLVPGYEDMGFPVAECYEDGSFELTKPEGTGGLVSFGTVAEQLLYEVGDPSAYLLPDVTCDLRFVTVEELGIDRVRISGVEGHSPPETYKVSATYFDGYRGEVAVVLVGGEAVEKGRRVAEAILAKTERMFMEEGWEGYAETNVDILGSESAYGPRGRCGDAREVVLRIAVKHSKKEAVSLFSREIAQAATGMAPGFTKILGGLPKPSLSICHFSFLIPRSMVQEVVILGDERVEISPFFPERAVLRPGSKDAVEEIQAERSKRNLGEVERDFHSLERIEEDLVEVPLIALAYARSGDKGNTANIGVVARKPKYFPYIKEALTEGAVADYFSHLVEGPVRRFEVPGIHGLNFLLDNALGGGGMASLRADPQGKAYGQILLDFPMRIPKSILDG